MASKNNLILERESLKSLSVIVETYQEIAAMRMRKIRDTVLKNRAFLAGLRDIYNELQYYKSIDPSYKEDLDTRRPRVVVILSANTLFYGNVLNELFSYITKDLTYYEDAEFCIIGKVGLSYFQNSPYKNKKYQYFEFPEFILPEVLFGSVIAYLLQYKTIEVYHSEFQDILNQVPSKSVISGQSIIKDAEKRYSSSYIFEPSLTEITRFFEDQLLSSIFEQTFFESNLSKFASRMVSLDSSVINTKQKVKNINKKLNLVNHVKFNRQQISNLAGISLWN